MDFRIEHDSMGEVKVEQDKLWGAQTQRSKDNFKIGAKIETMPTEIIRAFGYLKKASSIVNNKINPSKMTDEKMQAISRACDEIIAGNLDEHFPLVVFQTGSGTQTNMNVNEVIANYAKTYLDVSLHPNDDVNMSQSSNDTFPTAMHVASVLAVKNTLLPAINKLIKTFLRLENKYMGVVKCGRTHLQDATPITFGQEISGWRSSLEKSALLIQSSLTPLSELALGATAVGTGLNAPKDYDTLVAKEISFLTGENFTTAENKFHALTSKDELVFSHGAIKALGCDLMKIANDVRWLSSGPRLGLGEISIPENEPGSSIMPGKVNPTQCEALTMVAVQVMANDVAVGFSASQGNFELNVFMPVAIYNYLQSVRLLSDAINSFNTNCATGIVANEDKMQQNVNSSLMLITAISPIIGYENSALVAKTAFLKNITLKEACVSLGFMSEEEFDKAVIPSKMTNI